MNRLIVLLLVSVLSCHSGKYMGIPLSQLSFNICYAEPCIIEVQGHCCGSKKYLCWNDNYIYTYVNLGCTSAEYKLFEYSMERDSIVAIEKDYYHLDTNVGFCRKHCQNRGISWRVKDFRNTLLDKLIIEGSTYYREINTKTKWRDIKKTKVYGRNRKVLKDC